MIYLHERLQCFVCSVCSETVELRRAELRDPEALFFRKEQLQQQHAGPDELQTPAQCTYRKGMAKEMEPAEQGRLRRAA